MIPRLAAIVALALPLLAWAEPVMEMPSRTLEGSPAAPMFFRAPKVVALDAITFTAPVQKSVAAPQAEPDGPIRIGDVRATPKAARVETWTPISGGYVARLRATSAGALGIRTRLELGTVPGTIEVRVQGSDEGGRIEMMLVDPTLGNEAWTPWTEGPSQVIELFSRVEPSAGAVNLGAVVHFTDSPFTTKAAGTCTVSTMCTTGNAVLDAAITERKKSMARMNFIDDGGGFLCTGTLLNSERFPAPFFITANHCINNAAAAATLTTWWFYESTSCDFSIVNPANQQVAGGAQITFANYNVDSTLVRLNGTPPTGAVYSAWNRAPVAANTAIVSLSHPKGDLARLALGTVSQEFRVEGRPQDMYGVRFTRGIIEGGSSGSGLFVLNGTSLQLRGVLSGTTVRNSPDGLSCTNLNEDALYSRLEIFEPEIDQYLRLASQAADDAPNRAQDLFSAPVTDPNGADMPLNQRSAPLVLSKRLDYAGDVDVFRFTLTGQSTVHAWTDGALDTVGAILDSRGVNLEANDDEDVSANHTNFNFGITRSLGPGTYYVQVSHFDAEGTGAYSLHLGATSSAPAATPNYTDLWWNPAESGWGLNLNHQGSIVFGTLFTYDTNGSPMWLVLSRGDLQADGSFSGTLNRTTGPAFNAVPWTATTAATAVGTMRVAFQNATNGTLTYTVNNVTVTKSITREVFSTPPTCTFTTGNRAAATNYQDLWWNPAESGWGINVTHQGSIVFATLFTYDASGKGAWYVLSRGDRTGPGAYGGTLYSTTGPAFNASPWSAANPTAVGTMSFNFATGNSGTLTYSVNGVQVTKAIQRQVFSSPTTQCQ